MVESTKLSPPHLSLSFPLLNQCLLFFAVSFYHPFSPACYVSFFFLFVYISLSSIPISHFLVCAPKFYLFTPLLSNPSSCFSILSHSSLSSFPHFSLVTSSISFWCYSLFFSFIFLFFCRSTHLFLYLFFSLFYSFLCLSLSSPPLSLYLWLFVNLFLYLSPVCPPSAGIFAR